LVCWASSRLRFDARLSRDEVNARRSIIQRCPQKRCKRPKASSYHVAHRCLVDLDVVPAVDLISAAFGHFRSSESFAQSPPVRTSKSHPIGENRVPPLTVS
jgi:hypothetical protein